MSTNRIRSGISILIFRYRKELTLVGTQNGKTLEEIRGMSSLGKMPEELFHPILPEVEFSIGDMTLLPFSIDHDAANPVAYRISQGRKQVAVATDMGHYDQHIIDHLQGLDALLLESNHDIRMLETGPYPYYLKQRIMGDHGHLSNETAGRLLNCILHDHLKAVLLGHLSKENNYPELALESVRCEITQGDTPYRGTDFCIEVPGGIHVGDYHAVIQIFT